jgi:glycosyltransferase involved in cell wall biosynthesis
MRYLLINHVPFGRGTSDGRYVVGDMWLEDLAAQARAIREAGMTLVVATPMVEKLQTKGSGSFNVIEITPREHGFEYEPLPFYISMKQFLLTKSKVIERLAQVIRDADVVQIGYGGHPVALGEIALPLARKMNKRVIWVFDGADPFPRLELHAKQQKNPVKRWLQSTLVKRFAGTCREAVKNSDLVFAHNAAVVERFKDVWDERRCHAFDRSFVTDEILLSDADLAERQRRLLDASRPLRLVAAGRQIAIKATDHVLRALKQARDRGARLELDVLGEGDDLARFKALATELALDDVVRFGGTVPYGKPLFDAWSAAHVMVITNLTAEISRNVLLSMARGLPLIMYANAGTDELIRASGAGVLVPTGDVDALARAFEQAASDRAALAAQAAKGLATARTKTLDATHRKRAQLAASLGAGERERAAAAAATSAPVASAAAR